MYDKKTENQDSLSKKLNFIFYADSLLIFIGWSLIILVMKAWKLSLEHCDRKPSSDKNETLRRRSDNITY